MSYSSRTDIFGLIPPDLFRNFIFRYIGPETEEEIDRSILCISLIALQFVSKRFYTALMAPKSLSEQAILNYRYQKGDTFLGRNLLITAAREFGSPSLLQWLVKDLRFSAENSFAGALRGSHLELLEWIRSRGHPIAYVNSDAAASNERVILWLHQHALISNSDLPDLFSKTILAENISLTRWLLETPAFSCHITVSLQHLAYALLLRSVGFVDLLLSLPQIQEQEWTATVRAAALHPELQAYFLEKYGLDTYSGQWRSFTPQSISILERLRQEGRPIPQNLTDLAITQANAEVFLWCERHGYLNSYYLRNLHEMFYLRWDEKKIIQILEIFRARSEKDLVKELSKPINRFTAPVRVWFWRYLHSIGVLPNETSIRTIVLSPSFFALQTLRFVVEELKYELPKELILPRRRMKHTSERKDIQHYLASRGVIIVQT